MSRTILHCDMNNFFASVECKIDPSLSKYPIAVGGDIAERHGVVFAKNEKAKAFGVTTGETIWQAKQKCRDLIVVPPHREEYKKESLAAREIYFRYTDLVEPFGMDECWLDVTGSLRLFGSGEQIAEQIRQTIKRERGLTVSIGVSFNKIFAKLGSDLKKPDAVTVIPEESFREKIYHLPIGSMLGVGKVTEKKLASLGIHTIGELAVLPEDFLVRKFGKCGADILRYANGLDDSPVITHSGSGLDKTCGHGITTREDLKTPDEVWKVMLSLSQEIGHRLYKYGKRATGVAISIRDNKLKTKGWQTVISPSTRSALTIAREAFELFKRSYPWKEPIRSVTVRAIGLTDESTPEQLSFFDIDGGKEKNEARDMCVEDLRNRYGKKIIRSATLIEKKEDGK